MDKTILITNDDGIRAAGLKSLEKALSGLGRIVTVAPESEQSATSHAITLDRPLRIKEYAEDRFSVTGTPTDCVLLAVHRILDSKPDLVGLIAPQRFWCSPGACSCQQVNSTRSTRAEGYDTAGGVRLGG